MPVQSNRLRLIVLMFCLLTAPLSLLPSAPADAQSNQPAAGFQIFLPLLSSPDASTPPPPPPPPVEQFGGFFPLNDPQTRTTSSAVGLDSNGGMHTAFVSYEPGNPPVYYGYCAPGKACADPANWQIVTVARGIEEVQLQLTTTGKPRLLYRTLLSEDGLSREYVYAECNSTCTNAANWQQVRIAKITRSDILGWDLPQRSFALDRLDRPRFAYYTGTAGDPNKGAFYLSCDSDCTNAANWQQGPISMSSTFGLEVFYEPVLTFNSKNQPRMVVNISDDRDAVYYMECDRDCHDSSNWNRELIADRGQGPLAAWDLELDAQDRPRIAIYVEAFRDGGGDLLAYLWCDVDCTVSGNNWFGGAIGLEKGDGETPDLELDAQGRPWIAYHSPKTSSLNLLWCDKNCHTDGAEWFYDILEQNTVLEEKYAMALPPACEKAAWTSGYQPMMVLDSDGNPIIAGEAQRILRCLVRDPQDPTGPTEETFVSYRHARIVIAPKP